MFELIRETPMAEYDGRSRYYVHKATGMEVFHIQTKSGESCCSFMFNTPSEDSTGCAHIIEHTVLCGSKRFPVKDPFSQVLLSSPNTFLNAMTFCDKTMYPFASPLKKDFDILFDIYADAVFAPLLRRESFQQEGIRHFDGKFDGVVFNEMCGAMSTEDSIVQSNLTRDLYRGTPYEFNSGGDPLSIVDLTYEEYVRRYRKWYSPSNCRLFLFGDFDAMEYLDKLENRYLKNCEKGEKIIPYSEKYLQKDSTITRTVEKCPSGDARSVVLTWLTTEGSDTMETLTASILVSILLGNPGAPLYKAIMESDLGEDLNPISGTDVDGPALTFTAGFSHAKEGAEDEIEAFILNQIEGYVKNGLPEEIVNAAIKRMEFSIKEIPGDGIPFGIATCLRVARSWLRGCDPEGAAMNMERLRILKERVAKGRYFENWMEKNLLNNPRRVLLTVQSDDDYEKELQNALSEKMKLVGEDDPKEKKAFNRFIETPDSPEALATIRRITVKDLPKTIARYSQKETVLPSGARVYDFRTFTRGIVYVNMAFDTRNLTLGEKRLLPLLVRAIQMCGTKKHDFTVLSTLMKTLTGGFYMYPYAGCNVQGKPVSHVTVKTKMLLSDFSEAMDLIGEVLTEPDLSDGGRLKASISDMVTEFESGYSYSASSYAVMNASSVFSASAMESELNMGTALWFYLVDLKKDLESGKTGYDSLSAELTKLWEKVFTQRGMKIQITSDTADDSLVQIVSAFADRFKVGKFVRSTDYYRSFKNKPIPKAKRTAVYTLPSGPAFNAMTIRFEKDNEKTLVAMSLLASVLGSGYLWETIRGKSGAYGAESHVDNMENIFVFSTYRDPSVGKTFRTFGKALTQRISKSDIDYAVVTIIGKEIRPRSPQTKSSEAFRNVLLGLSTARYLRRRNLLLSMKPGDLEEAEKLLKTLMRTSASTTVVCGQELAKTEAPENNVALPL